MDERMSGRWRFGLVAVCGLLLLATTLVTACASATQSQASTSVSTSAATTVSTETTTTSQQTTTSADSGSTTAEVMTMARYRIEMKSLVAKHDASMATGWKAFGEITDSDVFHVTSAQNAALVAFNMEMKALVADLEKIEPPADVATSHAIMLDGYREMSSLVTQYLAALQTKDQSKIVAALQNPSFIYGDPIDEAAGKLEAALGFTLGSIRPSPN